jgi:peptidoglycan/xylan/chitin deacetylase (PgdA/CDA1 family)
LIFKDFGLNTTFYIVPGEPEFALKYAEQYSRLSLAGHEIGSHTYTHPHMTTLTVGEAQSEFIKAITAITALTSIYPSTFAFPHHDNNNLLVQLVKDVHFETRNTLKNASRLSLKTNTSIINVREQLKTAIARHSNVTFSGHSVISPPDSFYEPNYEPVNRQLVIDILRTLSDKSMPFEVLTFEQSAMKEYIKAHTVYDKGGCFLENNQMSFLASFGIDSIRLESII